MKTINGHQIYDGDAVFVLPADPRAHRLNIDAVRAAAGAHKQEHIIPDWCAIMREQGNVASCVAQAIASIGTLFDKLEMSTDFIYGNARSGSYEGLVADEALGFVLKSGNVTEADMPGNTEVTAVIEKAISAPSSMWSKAFQHRIEGYAYLCGHNSPKRDDEAVLTALDLGWPVFTIVGDAAKLYKTYWSGSDCLCDMDGTGGGSHAVVVIGYKYIGSKLYWRVRNSWGAWWGDKGYAWCEAGDNLLWSHMWAIYDSRAYIDVPGEDDEDNGEGNEMVVQTYSKSKQGSLKLSANFAVKEFTVDRHTGDTVLVADELVTMLQRIRDHFDKAVNISSGHRSSGTGQHPLGRAADFRITGVDPRDVVRWIEANLNPPGLGLYDYAHNGVMSKTGFVHIDVRTGAKARWVQTTPDDSTYRSLNGRDITVAYLGQGTNADRRTLKQGMAGADVIMLQEQLLALGYKPGVADGIFGAKTKAAVIAYQASRGLGADGIVGAKTWAALDKEA